MKKTLIVDANNLLTIGYFGVKDFYHNGIHVGGIWHFLNTTRKFIEEHNFEKVIVVWDGEENTTSRKLLYPQYKEGRKKDYTEEQISSMNYQKRRVKQYLEEMFVRQIEVQGNESDDLIAYYCQISPDEKKVILSSDKDLTQLISDSVSVYSPSAKTMYKKGDKIKVYNYEFPHENIRTIKTIIGDKSDNIDGIYFLGEKTLVKLFPELLEKKVSVQDILTRGEELLKEDKNNNTLKNLLSGRTKSGIYENEFFVINEKIVNLEEPMITDEGKEMVELYYKESLDPDGRGYKNIMRMMMDDGLFKYLPKSDDAWVYFIKPFLKLSRKEKSNYRTNK